jgi:hypothetical protein
MADTYKALSTVTVGAGGSSTITFSNIPQTYTDLRIVLSARTDRSGFPNDNIRVYPNGSSSNLSERYLLGFGSGVTSATDTSGLGAAGAVGASATASTFSNVEVYIPNYTGSTNKQFAVNAVSENNATDGRQGLTANLWSSTTPITSLTIVPSSGPNFVQYTTATLYGVFNADVSTPPATPTIGTATADNASASITFTGVSNAASYTMTSTPGSITGTGATSPITVSGLTNGTAYTFKVKSNNPFGSSAESAASNSVTPTPAAYESIATVSVGSGGASSISFSSIPSTYTHLQLRYIAQKTSNGSMYIRFNGDTGTNYTNHTLQGNGTAVSSNANTGANGTDIGASDSSGNFAASVIDILDYTNTNKNTTIRQLFGRDYNGSGVVWLKSGLWLNTAAVTSITLVPDSTNVVQNSHFALYGIKSS